MYLLLLGTLLHWLLLPLGARALYKSAKLLAKWGLNVLEFSIDSQVFQNVFCFCVALRHEEWSLCWGSGFNLTFSPLWATAWAFETCLLVRGLQLLCFSLWQEDMPRGGPWRSLLLSTLFLNLTGAFWENELCCHLCPPR